MKQKFSAMMSLVLFYLFVIQKPAFGEEKTLIPTTGKNIQIVVDLTESRLFLVKQDTKEIIKKYPIAGGKNVTPSPVGTWKVISKGQWSGGFGSRWMGINVPWGRYGIHGTNRPSSIGGPASHGCIRMFNKDIEEVYGLVNYGATVVIYGGPYGMFANAFRALNPGDRGSDVYEVQKRLKDVGYYNGNLDGIYGEGMKRQVIRFRKSKKLHLTHGVDSEFYHELGMKPFE